MLEMIPTPFWGASSSSLFCRCGRFGNVGLSSHTSLFPVIAVVVRTSSYCLGGKHTLSTHLPFVIREMIRGSLYSTYTAPSTYCPTGMVISSQPFLQKYKLDVNSRGLPKMGKAWRASS